MIPQTNCHSAPGSEGEEIIEMLGQEFRILLSKRFKNQLENSNNIQGN